jgi:ABC-type glutathione transport system ATPase component
MQAPHPPLLDIQRLSVQSGVTTLLHALSLRIQAGQRLAVVGSSGAGKSLLAHTLMGLLAPPLRVASGAIAWQGADLLRLSPAQRHRQRGLGQFLIFQSPGALLDPMLSVGWQLRQCAARVGAGPAEIVAALEQVGLEAQPVLRQHAGQLSGGMQQRVLIAMALLLRPQLVWADEPTSSLDSDTAAEVLQALALMQQQTGCALVLITHDLRIVAQHCEQIAVLEHGRLVETAQVAAFMRAPASAAGQALLRAAQVLQAGG